MKKSFLASAIALIITGSAFAQPVSDRAIIPLGVTLQQILRLHVTNGGNIEFVFNDITDYKEGINPVANPSGAQAFYTTDVVVASSTNWQLDMGAEDGLFMVGTDDPSNNATFGIDNVGFTLSWTGSAGAAGCCGVGDDATTVAGFYDDCATAAGAQNLANGLQAYTGAGTCVLLTSGATDNAGDILENAFSIIWEAGTGGGTVFVPVPSVSSPMNPTSLLDQNLLPDRYTTNVLLELTAI